MTVIWRADVGLEFLGAVDQIFAELKICEPVGTGRLNARLTNWLPSQRVVCLGSH